MQTNGNEWKRHRRMFTANLDERISRSVWTESCQQASDMVNYMVKNPGNQTLNGLKSVAINVIGQAGYSQKGVWAPNLRDGTGEAKTGKAAYWETLSLAAEMLIEAALLPTKVMRLPFMPPALRLLGYHMERASGYTKELSDEEKRAGQDQFSLSHEEISGSLFVFSTAGIGSVKLRALDQDPSTWNYEEVFLECRRTIAVMFEILRLFPPLLHSTRAVLEPQSLVSTKGTHILTPPMEISVCQLSMHLDTTVWGADASQFRLSRWIDDSGQLLVPQKARRTSRGQAARESAPV
ncbi:hypothetical protein AJ79_02513 [Helicocarpus griseus UAMH5409]|uniref:Cytochrome P450 n=1 Tax=Helicocarpus griseus UAMH5409 TaxID=1447875 RepID=A0A2B7Y3U2_9EURO|nr:hypothetical protein AJ79_02513 [Helicocarpus griseus UAMH5409]